MIDITGLRKDKRPQSSTVVHVLLDRLEAAEKSDAESLTMYRKARDERDALRADKATLQQMTYSLKDRLEAAEKEREELHALIAAVKKQANAEYRIRVKKEEECALLQAKIEQMERQEPAGTLHDDGCFVWRETAPHQSNYAGWKMVLYALPGAQGEEK